MRWERMSVQLNEKEKQALVALAERELRPARDQLRLILRCELLRLGLLAEEPADESENGACHE